MHKDPQDPHKGGPAGLDWILTHPSHAVIRGDPTVGATPPNPPIQSTGGPGRVGFL